MTDTKQKIIRRNHKGMTNDEFYKWPDQLFDEMESTLAVQQYIQQLIRKGIIVILNIYFYLLLF